MAVGYVYISYYFEIAVVREFSYVSMAMKNLSPHTKKTVSEEQTLL